MTTIPTNYARAALIRMDPSHRRALILSMRDKVNADPEEHDPLTALWFGILSEIVDLETDENAVLAELEKVWRL